jgi:hypothetical protein
MGDFIVSFKRLMIKTKGMIDTFFKEFFISGLLEEIKAQFKKYHLAT